MLYEQPVTIRGPFEARRTDGQFKDYLTGMTMQTLSGNSNYTPAVYTTASKALEQ